MLGGASHLGAVLNHLADFVFGSLNCFSYQVLSSTIAKVIFNTQSDLATLLATIYETHQKGQKHRQWVI